MTNKEKFKEVFGFTPRTDTCDLSPNICNHQKTCDDCPFKDFWDKEYRACFRLKDEFDDRK